METGALQNILLFLTDTLLSLYMLALLLRFLFMLIQADFYNPLSQAIVQITQTPVKFVRTFIPTFGRVDLACGLLACGVKTLELFLLGLIQGKIWPLAVLLVVGLIQVAETLIYIYIFALIILAISSWFIIGRQALNHPLISLLYSLTTPILAPVRRIIPASGGIDFSPMVLLIALYLLLTILRSFY